MMTNIPGPRIILHIGFHKTGSTTLQNALVANRDVLRAQSYFYPSNHLPSRSQHSHLALFLRSGDEQKYHAAAEAILADFSDSGCTNLILSGEEFSTLRDEHLPVLFNTFLAHFSDVRVVLYVRNLYRLMLSLISEYRKGVDAVIYPQIAIARMRAFNPSQVIERWEHAVGKDNVELFCLEALPAPAGLIESFQSFAGCVLSVDPPEAVANRSLDPIASSLLSHLAFEFRIPSHLYYWAYYADHTEHMRLARLDQHYCDLMDEWAANVNLSHNKIADFAELLRAKPAAKTSEYHYDRMQAADYMDQLAKTLRRTSAALRKSVSGA